MSSARFRSIASFLALVLATLVVGHHVIYFFAHAHGDDYVHAAHAAGHDAYWANFLLVVVGVVMGVVVLAGRELRRLARLASSMPSGAIVKDAGVRRLVGAWLPVFAKIGVATIVAFLVQENLERASVGEGFPGLGVFIGDHVIAIPVLLVVAAVVALCRALVRWRRDILLARIRRRSPARGAAAELRPVVNVLPLLSADGHGSNGTRAPPVAGAAPA